MATPPSPSLGMREAVEDCFLVLYTGKMEFNKEKQGQNKAREHQASSHPGLQNQDFGKDPQIFDTDKSSCSHLEQMFTKQPKIPQHYLCSGMSKAAERKVPLTDTS